ncbi:putative NAD(P)H quinone oxidoreductase, PIG3 family [Microlunatus sagamiharensis]|uniref:Putative NAD(P)H quinone oxidoreductase, PIG3 family n=1 Tax=Microlunatus sagamiharensis TaxID=546874 RepID=A0A1H2NCW5_9ACTN|nr:putative NAD(P)H quinone oxidoreductase, PIG3 family [Microlunatus sagamiharensis]
MVTEPGEPEVLRVEEVPEVEPGPGEVLVEVVAAGVNRADLMQRQGHYPPPPGASETIGLEVSGHVAALGEGVDGTDGLEVGQPCVALLAGGGYAERVVVPAGQVLPPPPGYDLVDAAGVLEVAATVWSTLAHAHLSSGETFLVHGGAGGIGSFAIQYARALGATVVATAGSEDKLQHCRDLGADHAFSYREDWAAQTKDAVGGVDVVLDNMGAKYLETHVDLLAPDGRLVVIGFQGGRRATLDLGALLPKRLSVAAISLRGRPLDQKADICRHVAEEVWPLLGDGTIRPTPLTTYALDDVVEAHRRLESGDNVGKIVLRVSSSHPPTP